MVRSAVRSLPAPGSVRAKALSRSPRRQPGQEPLLLLVVAERAHRIDGADAAVDRREAGDGGIDRRHPREKRRERRERRARAAVLAVDQQAPVAGGAELGEHGVGDLALVVEQRAGVAMAAHDFDRGVHHRLHVGGRLRRLRWRTAPTGTPRSHTARWAGLLTV